MRLKDKVIIITGATSGIGKALTVRAVAEGAKVLIHGISKEDGQKLLDHLGKSVALCIADLEDLSSPKKIVDCALDAFGQIDAVVNNAASIERSNLQQITPEAFTKTITINLQSALFLVQAAFAHLKKTGTMTRNLANAHGVDGVRFNLINPGWILTDREYADQIKKGLPENWPTKLGPENIPFGKMSTPEQLASACIYWLSDESKPFTGSVVDLEQFSIIGRNPGLS